MMTAVFTYSGADLVATTAGESENPEKDLPRAIKYTVLGLIITYGISLVVLLAVLPWRSTDLLGSPFAYVFREVGLPGAELVVNIVLLTSALSSANAFVYSCTRTLMSMGIYEQAPSFVSKVNEKKVPMNALIITMLFGILAGIGSVLSQDKLYLFLASLTGITDLFVYIIYGICIFKFRRQYILAGNKVEDLKFKVPLYPLTPMLLIFFCAMVFLGMIFDPTQKLALLTGIPLFTIVYLLGLGYYRKQGKKLLEGK